MAGTPSWADDDKQSQKRLKKRLLYIWPLSTSKRLWGGRRGRRAGGTEARGRHQDEKKENILSWAERSDAGRWVRFEPSHLFRILSSVFSVLVMKIKGPPSVSLGASLADRHGLPSSQGESVLGQKEPKRVGRKGEAREQEREQKE